MFHDGNIGSKHNLGEIRVYRDGNSHRKTTTACELHHSLVEELISSLV
jgi:hypothetical protein